MRQRSTLRQPGRAVHHPSKASASAVSCSKAIQSGADWRYFAISTDATEKLARALGVSVDYLIGTFEDDEPGDSKPASVAVVGA